LAFVGLHGQMNAQRMMIREMRTWLTSATLKKLTCKAENLLLAGHSMFSLKEKKEISEKRI
jgi:hypothetical protein